MSSGAGLCSARKPLTSSRRSWCSSALGVIALRSRVPAAVDHLHELEHRAVGIVEAYDRESRETDDQLLGLGHELHAVLAKPREVRLQIVHEHRQAAKPVVVGVAVDLSALD